MVNSRQKGKRGELAWRDELREAGYDDARRGRQYSGDPSAPDVVGGPDGWHAEVKVREQHDIWRWIEQATRDAGDARPYVAVKKNRRGWLIVMRPEDFFYLLRKKAASAPPDAPHAPVA